MSFIIESIHLEVKPLQDHGALQSGMTIFLSVRLKGHGTGLSASGGEYEKAGHILSVEKAPPPLRREDVSANQ
jgi:hypothetical protein